MRDVFRFSCVTHAVTLDGFRQDHSWFVFRFRSLFECSEQFTRIMTTTFQSKDLLVSPVSNQCGSFRVFSEEVFTDISTIFGFESLIVTIQRFVHQLDQLAGSVFLQQRIPTGAPQNFDYIPACAAKHAFQLIDNFTVTNNRTIQTLQVTVDNKDQVIQFFTHSDSDSAFRFRLIHLTVTQEGIHFLL